MPGIGRPHLPRAANRTPRESLLRETLALIGRLTETLALIGGAVDKHFGGDDIAEGQKHLHELSVAKLLRQVVDEEVAALRTAYAAAW